jgi:hypothetical protein
MQVASQNWFFNYIEISNLTSIYATVLSSTSFGLHHTFANIYTAFGNIPGRHFFIISVSAVVVFIITSLVLANRPHGTLFSHGKKNQVLTSPGNGSCSKTITLCLARYFLTIND